VLWRRHGVPLRGIAHQGRSNAVDAAGGYGVVQIAGVANYKGPVNQNMPRYHFNMLEVVI
jgi:hypothetical protein